MSLDSRADAHNRLAELVVELSGVGPKNARNALDEALARNGDSGDQLLNIADAIMTLRNGSVEISTPPSPPREDQQRRVT
jgi:hypothetical protein